MNYEEINVYLADGSIGRFDGAWLNDPKLNDNQSPEYYNALNGDRQPRFGHDGAPEEWRVGVAETFGGVVVYIHHWNYDYDKPSEVLRFDSLDEAMGELKDDPRVPRYLINSLPRYYDI